MSIILGDCWQQYHKDMISSHCKWKYHWMYNEALGMSYKQKVTGWHDDWAVWSRATALPASPTETLCNARGCRQSTFHQIHGLSHFGSCGQLSIGHTGEQDLALRTKAGSVWVWITDGWLNQSLMSTIYYIIVGSDQAVTQEHISCSIGSSLTTK